MSLLISQTKLNSEVADIFLSDMSPYKPASALSMNHWWRFAQSLNSMVNGRRFSQVQMLQDDLSICMPGPQLQEWTPTWHVSPTSFLMPLMPNLLINNVWEECSKNSIGGGIKRAAGKKFGIYILVYSNFYISEHTTSFQAPLKALLFYICIQQFSTHAVVLLSAYLYISRPGQQPSFHPPKMSAKIRHLPNEGPNTVTSLCGVSELWYYFLFSWKNKRRGKHIKGVSLTKILTFNMFRHHQCLPVLIYAKHSY